MIILTLLAVAAASSATPAPGSAPFATAVPLDTASLDKATAREDIALIASAEQTAQVSNNSVTGNSTTGNVAIDGNAFQNSQGLTLINANSGNNVAINSALNVNIRFSPN